jgi:hypothetical protein
MAEAERQRGSMRHWLTFHRRPAEFREARFGAGLNESELGLRNPKRLLNFPGALLLEIEPDQHLPLLDRQNFENSPCDGPQFLSRE